MVVFGIHAKGLLEGCELWGNARGGVWVQGDGDPTLVACILRDHTDNAAAGVHGCSDARGKATVAADCVFARNAGGGFVRE